MITAEDIAFPDIADFTVREFHSAGYNALSQTDLSGELLSRQEILHAFHTLICTAYHSDVISSEYISFKIALEHVEPAVVYRRGSAADIHQLPEERSILYRRCERRENISLHIIESEIVILSRDSPEILSDPATR